MRSIIVTTMMACVLAAGASAQQGAPYAGQDQRGIKSLSANEIDDLLAGRGMGLAKAAELNSYPGPAHALDLADVLKLSADQRAALGAIRMRMSERAVALGRQLIGLESDLERAFANGAIDPEQLVQRTGQIGQIQAALRTVHLQAHIETKALLSGHQIQLYNEARGYQGRPAGNPPAHKH